MLALAELTRHHRGSTTIGGAAAVVESSEGSVRENVKALVLAAAERWPRNAQ